MKKSITVNVIIFIVGLIVSSIISFKINEDIGYLFLLILMMIYVLRIAIWFREHINNKEIESNISYVKYKPKMHYNLFTWLGEEKSSDKIIYELIGDIIEKPTTIQTLIELKNLIKNKINGDLVDYYLVREMIRNSRKESFGEFFKSSFGKIALGSIGVALITTIIKEGYVKKLIQLVGLNQSNFMFTFFTIVIYFLLIVIVSSTLYALISKSNRRANVVIMILDEIIKEIETEKTLNSTISHREDNN